MWDEFQRVTLKHPEIEGIIVARRAACGDPQSDIGQLLLDSFRRPAKVLAQSSSRKKLGGYLFTCREARRIPIPLCDFDGTSLSIAELTISMKQAAREIQLAPPASMRPFFLIYIARI